MTFDVSILTKKVPFLLAGAAAAAMFAGSTAHAVDSNATGYVYSPEVSTANGGWNWLENGKPYTGFRYHAGTFYWFVNGVRQNEGWRQAWGLTYYTDQDGRAVQGTQVIDGKAYNFGDDNTFYSRPVQGYVWDGSSENGGYRWYENGQLYTGFRYYAGTYYWFVNGVRQNAGWRQAWGYTYYTDNDGRAVQGNQVIDGKAYNFGDDNTFYSRPVQGYVWDGSSENGGYRWYEDGQLYTGFRYYAGTYYWFVDGVRQNAGWRQAWGNTYYTNQDGRAVQGQVTIDGTNYDFGNDGTYYLRIPGTNTATAPGFGGAPDADRSKDTVSGPTTDTNQTTTPATSTPTRTYTGWVKNEKGTVIWQKSDFTTMKEAETTTTNYMNTHMWDQGDMEPYSYGAY